MLNIDYRSLVSRADIVYLSPPEVSIEGLPIGNGCMGMTLWTTPSSVRTQINRNDIFSSDQNHAGSHRNPVDYRGACAQIDVDVGSSAFAGTDFRQHLGVYDAECTTAGAGIEMHCFVSAAADLLVLEIDDRRLEPRAIRLTVSMWRPPEVVTPLKLVPLREDAGADIDTGTHTARYEFTEDDGRLLLVQQFHETRVFRDEQYRGAAALAVGVLDAATCIEQAAPLWFDDAPKPLDAPLQTRGAPQARAICIPAAAGKRTILVSSAASTASERDVGGAALALLDAASSTSHAELRRQHLRWWHAFWERTFVHLSSADGLADFMERVRTLHLYYTASSSRGDVPAPQIAGLNFQTVGDITRLGTQLWHWIEETTYTPLFAADAMDLTDPYFDMYVRQLPACRSAARQRWGVQGGAFFPETSPPAGPVVLPEDCAAEFREYFLGRAPVESLSTRTLALCQHDSQLYYITHYDQHYRRNHPEYAKPHAAIGHLAATGSKIALHAWWRYRSTGDAAWLRSHAYPLLRATAEFYRHMVCKGADGLYHIEGTNVMESFILVRDSLMDLAAIRGVVPLALRAAEILDLDAELRAGWRDLRENLAPYPMGSDAPSKALKMSALADDAWAAGHLLELNVEQRDYPSEDVWAFPIHPFQTWTLETRKPQEDAIAQRTLDLCPNHRKVMTGMVWRPSLVRTPMAYARASRGAELPALLAAHYGACRPGSDFPPMPLRGGWNPSSSAIAAARSSASACAAGPPPIPTPHKNPRPRLRPEPRKNCQGLLPGSTILPQTDHLPRDTC